MLERFKPEPGPHGELHAQHLSRYEFASRHAAGKKVVDVACGTGYGSSLLRRHGAASVTGIDISEEAIAHAKREYAAPGISFLHGDVSTLRVAGPADCIVSFETIEHLNEPENLLIPARELLGPGGHFIVSTPVRHVGSLTDRPANPFHVREWNEEEFDRLLEPHFPERRFHFQYVYRKYPWPLSRTINRSLLAAFFRGGSAGFGGFPVVGRPWAVPGPLIEKGYMIVVCSGKAG
jgi:SAM-dependent methyltransferase